MKDPAHRAQSVETLFAKCFAADYAAQSDPKATPTAARLSLALDAAILRERNTRT